MSSGNKRAGIIYVKVDGVQYDAKGSFTFNTGGVQRTAIEGADSIHGFATKPVVPFIEGKITDSGNLDVKALKEIEDATVTLELENGKMIVWENAWYAAPGEQSTEEGEIDFRFEARKPGEEI